MIPNHQVSSFIQKIKHYLITNIGKTEDRASLEEFYIAFVISLREEIMINWISSLETIAQSKARTIHYLSMEYLPGKYLGNNIANIHAQELIAHVAQKMGRSYSELLACETDPGLGNGGLGRLASCFLDSLSTRHYPYFAYGLRYQYGIFDQEIWNGVQRERPDCWLLNSFPWEFRKDTEATLVRFEGYEKPAVNSKGDIANQLEGGEEVRALAYDTPIIGYSESPDFSVGTLRLWSTKESPRNFELQKYNAGQLELAAENTSLTDVLYPNDNHEVGKRTRLKQEFLLVAASLQDITLRHLRIHKDMDNFGDKVRLQINDTHPALAVVELMRRLMTHHDFSWDKAWETTQACCSYTNHTVLKEALEEWNEKRIQFLLPRQFRIIQLLNEKLCSAIRAKFPGDEEKVRRMSILGDGQVKMAHLSIFGSHKVNGVAALHSKLLTTDLFKDFYELYPDKFINITNGVTPRRWLFYCNPLLSQLISDCIGNRWVFDFTKIKEFASFADNPSIQKRFLEIKQENKKNLFEFLIKENPIRNVHGKIVDHSPLLSLDTLVDVQIKRIHEYKRALLNTLHTILLYQNLKKDPHSHIRRMVLIGGKAAPGYEMAKRIIRLIYAIGRKINHDPDTKNNLLLIFIENYNASKAEMIIPAAELSEQISTAGMEASGTGNMKLAMNGALTIGTDDGANIEMRQAVGDDKWPFLFGSSAEEIASLKKSGSYQPRDLYIHNPEIKQVLDTLNEGLFAENEEEDRDFKLIYQSLLDGYNGSCADPFFVLKDFASYVETQKKVEYLYKTPVEWAKIALHTISSLGNFSSDVSIDNYAAKIWDITPCPPSPEILAVVREEYAQHDRCRILED